MAEWGENFFPDSDNTSSDCQHFIYDKEDGFVYNYFEKNEV